MKDLKLIPFDELISKTKFTREDVGVRPLAESSMKSVHVKDKLRKLYRSLNTGGTPLPFNVMEVALIIDKLILEVGTKTSSDSDGFHTIELTLLSDKGVEWLNKVNSIVKETKNKENRIVTAGIVEGIEIDKMIEEFIKHLDESELLYED